jgi:hypothetical protein
MLRLLDTGFAGIDIIDFQYGKTDGEIAWPVFTVAADDATVLAAVPQHLEAAGFPWEDLTGAIDVDFRAIPLRGDLLGDPAAGQRLPTLRAGGRCDAAKNGGLLRGGKVSRDFSVP